MGGSGAGYLPAAGRVRVGAVYDPVLRVSMRERRLRSALVAQTLTDPPPRRVLDLGTGTGSFAIELSKALPAAHLTGLDPDASALRRARAKAPAGSAIEWVQGRASELAFSAESFDAVTCSLVLHHLDRAEKLAALTECRRVLIAGGSLQIADWGAARDPLMWLAFLSIRLLDGFARTRDHAAGRLGELIEQAGFVEVRVHRRLRTCWGPLELISARAGQAGSSSARMADSL